MTLSRFRNAQPWDPFSHLTSLREEIDRLFDQSEPNWPQQFWLGGGWPGVDLHENRDQLILKLEIPGMKKEDIDISLHDGVLTISGERKTDARYESAETHRNERFVGRFQRAVALPVQVQGDKANANYQDGILTITLPKAEEAKPKQIQVQSE